MKRNLCLLLCGLAWSSADALPVTHRSALQGPRTSLVQRLVRKASFAEEWSRYPSPDAILNDLHARFPRADLRLVQTNCRQLTKDTRAALGDSDPFTGAPAMDRPNAAFVNWYVGCLSGFIRYEHFNLSGYLPLASVAEVIPMSALRACAANDNWGGAIDLEQGTFKSDQFFCRWNKMPAESQRETVRELATRLIGPPEVWVDLGLAANADELIDQIVGELADYDSKSDRRYDMVDVLNHPLTAGEAVKVIELLLNLQNTLKY